MTADTFITILTASGVILVTIASMRHNKNYREAKEAQITALKQLISPDVFEYFEKSRKILGESIQSLKDEIGEKKKEIDRLTQKHDATNQALIAQLRSRTTQLGSLETVLSSNLSRIINPPTAHLIIQTFAPTVSTSPPPESDDK